MLEIKEVKYGWLMHFICLQSAYMDNDNISDSKKIFCNEIF